MKLSMRSGWRDTGNTPAVFEEHAAKQNGDPAGPFIEARLWDASGKLLVVDKTPLDGPGGASLLFDNVGYFLTQLRTPEAAKAELLFVHLGARKPTNVRGVEGHPAAVECSGDTLAAVEQFVNACADSVHPTGAWASCKWAILEITK